ncbi:hypothetical protein PIB30_031567 [Stylosanthes scabra]|uniref:Uncharacterized protein n=1 Tax=Stylosanthes scabra TaxID=79078 RepID=A0ABU6RC42_9FABA|nr:hypothetical protein [Stylosanthes scabra]
MVLKIGPHPLIEPKNGVMSAYNLPFITAAPPSPPELCVFAGGLASVSLVVVCCASLIIVRCVLRIPQLCVSVVRLCVAFVCLSQLRRCPCLKDVAISILEVILLLMRLKGMKNLLVSQC